MLKSMSGWHLFIWNVLIIGLWNVVTFVACQKMKDSRFDPSKPRYLPKEWERGGRFYRDKFKIQLWKDKVPQFISKDGFSKEHIEDLSLEYIDRFILETCRGEWMHFATALCAIVVLILDPLRFSLPITALILLGSLPFAVIQRYNRFRLQIVRRKLLREQHGENMKTQTATA